MGASMQEVTVASLGLDKSSNTPVVILKEKEGDRVLPIWIGPGEASAIAMKLAGIEFSRPLTHDLLNTVVRGLGSELVRVLITKVVENTYYASLIFRKDGELISVDSRPSDSIALALRAEAPIFAEEELLELTALEIEEAAFEPGESEAELLGQAGEGAASGSETSEGPGGQALKDYLRGLNPEDFGRFTP
ncbi:MAG TPA: bifunctional nuclease family protein [Gemmatimonadota bacterium]|nr:bifunctional nuclease family protein [Gemmatimonadota bacterium]